MSDHAVLEAAVAVIRTGDVLALRQLLAVHPGLAARRLPDDGCGRTLLHVATDWPGHFPNVAATIATLVDAGADPNAACTGIMLRRRCTGRPAATTSPPSMHCWT